MLAKRSLQLGGIVVVATLTVGLLSAFGVGLSEPPPATDDIPQGLVESFEFEAEEYLLWGRWLDLGTALAFLSLLVAAPFLPGAGRAKYLLVAGAGIAVVGDLIDLSQLVGIGIAEFSLDNGLTADFTAGNVFRIAINTTSSFVWVGGLVVTALGMLILAGDAEDRSWGRDSASLAAALFAVAATDILASPEVFQVTSWIFAVVVLYWFLKAIRQIDRSPPSPAN